MGFIYIIKNTINFKIYIGQTRDTIESRWNGHKSSFRTFLKDRNVKSSALHSAFDKYGIDIFFIIKFREYDDNLLDEKEMFYIKVLSTLSPNGYNLRKGGNTSTFSEESKLKMKESKTGDKNPNFGKPRSDEFKNILSIKKSGENHHYYGKNLENDHLLKLSKSHKKGGTSEGLPMYMVYVKARPQHYCSEGYAILNHPKLKNKYFTSKTKSLEEKFILAEQYLNQIIE